MVGDLFAIFKARRDPALAARLAARFAQGQLLDRVSAPLGLVVIALWAATGVCALLVAGTLWAGIRWHWSAALPGVLLSAVGFVAFRLQAGLRAGLDRVRGAAEALTDHGMDRILSSGRIALPADACEPAPADLRTEMPQSRGKSGA